MFPESVKPNWQQCANALLLDRFDLSDREDAASVVFVVLTVGSVRWGPRLLHYSMGWATIGVIATGALVSIAAKRLRVNQRTASLLLFCAVTISALPVLTMRSLEGLAPTNEGAITTVAELVTDPEASFGQGTVVVLRIQAKRYRVTLRGPTEQPVARSAAGSRFVVSATVRPWPGSIPAWAVAKHLAGNATIRSAEFVDDGTWPWRCAAWIRQRMAHGAQGLPSDQRPLFGGFVLGDDRGQRAEITDDFRAAGLSHLLVVSGQNVAFVLAAATPLLRVFGPKLRGCAALAIIIAFALLTRFEPSVLRASVMAGATVLARTSLRPQRSLRLLCLSVVSLIVIDPLLCWSVGFGLSVGATAGLALLVGPIEARLRLPHTLRWLKGPLAATAAAQVGTFPLLVGLGGVSPVSIAANLLALPAAEPVMIWGVLIGVPAGLLGQPASAVLHTPDRVLMWWISTVARLGADVVRNHPVRWWWPIAMLVALGLWGRRIRVHGKRLPLGAILAGAVVALSLLPQASSGNAQPLGRSRTMVWRQGASVAMLLRPSTDPGRALADLRQLRVNRFELVAIERSTNQTWSSLGPILARHDALVIVQCGMNTTLNGRQVVGLTEGDLLRVRRNDDMWLVVRCQRGRLQITTGDP
jgi:competence protein ComEC